MAAEAEEEAVSKETREGKAKPVDPATPTGPQTVPAQSIGNLGRGRGYALTDTTALGGTTKAPDQDIIETLL